MKKIFYMFAAALMIVACSKSEEVAELSVSTSSLTFTADGGSQSFAVYGDGDWTISNDGADWYTYVPKTGNGVASVEVTVPAYTAAAGRSSVLTITMDKQTYDVTIIQNRKEVPSDPSTLTYNVNAQARDIVVPVVEGYDYTVSVPDGYEVEQGESSITIHIPANETGADATDEIVVTTEDGQTLQTITINRDARKLIPGELTIDEIFFAGMLLSDSSTDANDGDQYIVIGNRSDYDQNIDGLLFLMGDGSQAASTGAVWVYPAVTDSIPVKTIYAIPEGDYTIPAGEQIIIALAAQNFNAENGVGCDLSAADFEIYDDAYDMDVDNPDVTNLDTWFKSSATITILHNRGYESYAIAMAPDGMTADEFMADYVWNGKRTMDFNGFHFEKAISGYYLVPNEWVVDGVNCAVTENLNSTLWFNSTIDAGYTNVTSRSDDESRFGKCVVRTQDTNNSTNDFEISTPKL